MDYYTEAAPPAAVHKAPDLLGVTLEELQCPICVETIQDPFVTPCGHTFCYTCLSRHLANKKTCPTCSRYLTAEQIYPNFLLSKVLKKAAQTSLANSSSFVDSVKHLLDGKDVDSVQIGELEATITLLSDRKREVQQVEDANSLQLLLLFLQHSRSEKAGKVHHIQQQLLCLQQDLQAVAGTPPVGPLAGGLLEDTAGSGGGAGHLHARAQPNGTDDSSNGCAAAGPAGSNGCAAAGPAGSKHVHAIGSRPHKQHLQQPQQQQQQVVNEGAATALQQPLPSRPFALATPPDSAAAAPSTSPAMPSGPAMGSHTRSAFTAVGRVSSGTAAMPEHTACAERLEPDPNQGAAGGSTAAAAPAAAPGALGRLLQHTGVLSSSSPDMVARAGSSAQQATAAPAGGGPLHSQPQHQMHARAHALPKASSAGSLQPQPAAGAAGQASQLLADGSGPGRPSSSSLPLLQLPAAASSGRQHSEQHATKRRRILMQFEELQQCYFNMRLQQGEQQQQEGGRQQQQQQQPGKQLQQKLGEQQQQQAGTGLWAQLGALQAPPSAAFPSPPAPAVGPAATPMDADTGAGLREFTNMLSVATRYTRLAQLAMVRNTTGRSSAIISSLAFDCEQQLFASAGVLQRISLYSYPSIVCAPAGAEHAPVRELPSRAKLSSLCFSPFARERLLSCDYEGVVSVWDVATGQRLQELEAHSKRIWSVDCSRLERGLFATASDDCRVKAWQEGQPPSCQLSVDVKANVCAVACSPADPHTLVVGAASHHLHMYDLRAPREPLRTLRGHGKTISYVQWLPSGRELVSASTDGSVRLWSAGGGECLSVYSGHANEKNFVGLAAGGDFIACGSETNEVVMYYRPMAAPLLRHRLWGGNAGVEASGGSASAGGAAAAAVAAGAGGSSESSGHFVTALCWRTNTQELLAANSQGNIFVLGLAQ